MKTPIRSLACSQRYAIGLMGTEWPGVVKAEGNQGSVCAHGSRKCTKCIMEHRRRGGGAGGVRGRYVSLLCSARHFTHAARNIIRDGGTYTRSPLGAVRVSFCL